MISELMAQDSSFLQPSSAGQVKPEPESL